MVNRSCFNRCSRCCEITLVVVKLSRDTAASWTPCVLHVLKNIQPTEQKEQTLVYLSGGGFHKLGLANKPELITVAFNVRLTTCQEKSTFETVQVLQSVCPDSYFCKIEFSSNCDFYRSSIPPKMYCKIFKSCPLSISGYL